MKLALKGVTTPFEVSSFDGLSDRKSLDLRTTPALREFCARLDGQLQSQGAKIGCKADGYKSLLKPQKEGYDITSSNGSRRKKGIRMNILIVLNIRMNI